MEKSQNDFMLLCSLLIGVIVGAFVGLNILAMVKGFEGGLIGALRELSLRFR